MKSKAIKREIQAMQGKNLIKTPGRALSAQQYALIFFVIMTTIACIVA